MSAHLPRRRHAWRQRGLLGLLAVAGLSVTLPAQTFRSGVDAVMVDVLVTRGGRPVDGLSADDFTVTDNGVRQRIETVLLEDAPITLLLVLDISGSVGGSGLDRLRAAALAAGDALGPDDRVGLVTFSDTVHLAVEPPAPPEQLPLAVGRVRAGGATALYDATFAALTLRAQTGQRTVMLVFSDGNDSVSWLDPRDVLDTAQRSDMVVYAVTLDRDRRVTLMNRQHRDLTRQWFPVEPQRGWRRTPAARFLPPTTLTDCPRRSRGLSVSSAPATYWRIRPRGSTPAVGTTLTCRSGAAGVACRRAADTNANSPSKTAARARVCVSCPCDGPAMSLLVVALLQETTGFLIARQLVPPTPVRPQFFVLCGRGHAVAAGGRRACEAQQRPGAARHPLE